MTKTEQQQLGKTVWDIADSLRGAMNADDFRDYMLSFLFLRYLSSNYERGVKDALGEEYPNPSVDALKNEGVNTALQLWYKQNPETIAELEDEMLQTVYYVIKPAYLWENITELARTQSDELLSTLKKAFRHIEEESFKNSFQGLFSEINLDSEKLADALGDAYEYLIDQFAANSGKKAGEFYTPQPISTILSEIVSLDSQDPTRGYRKAMKSVLDFACGSGSLLLNVRKHITAAGGTIGKLYGQEKNITTYNLARMNMLLHGVKETEFEIFHGDTLTNDWAMLKEENPAKKKTFDAVVANPPFSLRWEHTDALAEDFRFKSYGLASRSAADFAFLLHGFHFLSDEGTMAIILPHGVLFRGGVEERIRTKLLKDGHIDTVIGLPANLFYSTGIPVCIVVLKKCKRADDILFINASEHFEKGRRQNFLRDKDIERIVETYKYRAEGERYARRVQMAEIEANGYNLNISRYVSTAVEEARIDLSEVHRQLAENKAALAEAEAVHNAFLRELGLKEL